MKEIKNNTEREHEYRKRLGEFPWEEEFGIIYFPLDLSIKLKRPIPEECSIFSSAMAPFKMTFETEDSGKHTFIYKNGDDLRQDQLILEMFSLMDNLLKGVNQDYRLTPYQTLATSKSDGFV
jgi:phosphatidylinositol 3-kinase